MNRARDQSGFTLVELLIALALLGLLSLAIFGELRFGTRVWSATARVDQDADAIGAAQALLRQKLAAAYPILSRATDSDRHVDFDGGPDALSFVTTLPDRAGTNIIGKLSLRAAPAPGRDGQQLLAGWRPELGVGSEQIDAVESPLVERIQSLRFAYYGQQPGRPTPEWSNRWSNLRDLPLLVGVTVTFADGDRRQWPELIVALQVRADVTCVYDPLIHDCRQR